MRNRTSDTLTGSRLFDPETRSFRWTVTGFAFSFHVAFAARIMHDGVSSWQTSYLYHICSISLMCFGAVAHVTRRFRGGRSTEAYMLKQFAAHTPYIYSDSQSSGYREPHELSETRQGGMLQTADVKSRCYICCSANVERRVGA